jgi:hypothetical protein
MAFSTSGASTVSARFGAGGFSAARRLGAAVSLDTPPPAPQSITPQQAQVAAIRAVAQETSARQTVSAIASTQDIEADLRRARSELAALSAAAAAAQAATANTVTAATAVAAQAAAAAQPFGVCMVRMERFADIGGTINGPDNIFVGPIAVGGVRRLDPAVFSHTPGDEYVVVLREGWFRVTAEVTVAASEGDRRSDGYLTVQVGTSPNPGVDPYVFSPNFRGTSATGADDTTAVAYFNVRDSPRSQQDMGRAWIECIVHLQAQQAVRMELTSRPERTNGRPGNLVETPHSYWIMEEVSGPVV